MKNKSLWILLSIFCFVLFTKICIIDRLPEIYVSRANLYYKKNDIPTAQKFYEKAFSLGLKNFKAQNAYINSIINSPLTLDSQEKLVKFLKESNEDAIKLKIEYFLYDLKREIHRKFPKNYITNTVYNQKVMRWGELPITYSFVNTEDVPTYFIREIENALTEWEKATEHQILFAENNENANIIIKFNQQNPDDDEQKFIVAYTKPILETNTLKNMEIIFYLKDPQNKYFSQNQVYNTALHEIVHALGFMGHCNDLNNIMYLTKDSISVLKDSRETLTQADINTVKLLYKIKPQITNTDKATGEYIPYLVLGAEKEVNSEKIREAKIYIKKAPNLPSGYIDLAEGYLAAKDYIKAVRSLEKALTLADSDEMKDLIYYNLAVAHFYVDNLDKAKEYLKYSMRNEDSDEKHYLMAEIYVREGNTAKAIEEYSSLIVKNPNNIEYTIALANIHVLNNDYILARNVLKNYIKYNPTEKNNPRFKPYGIIRLGL